MLSATLIFFACASLLSAETSDWVTKVRAHLAQNDLPGAAHIVDERLHAEPEDLEALGWRARILGWSGKWSEAEAQYREVLRGAPRDLDILIGVLARAFMDTVDHMFLHQNPNLFG